LKVSGEAVRDMHAADAWWRANRPSAPHLFRQELRRAFAVLPEQPELGAAAIDAPARGIRRLLLRGTRYFVYYPVQVGDIEVLRVWHASRRTKPTL
jgi:plasmid stabilization system protein ParE